MNTKTADVPTDEVDPFDFGPTSVRGGLTWEIARQFPLQGDWTEEQYFALDTNHLIEFDDGQLVFLPLPNIEHHLVLQAIYDRLSASVDNRRGTTLFAPFPVKLRPGRYCTPDAMFFGKQRTLTEHFSDGADVVVEVVSPGQVNRDRDLIGKRTEYAQAGIAEYWIADPQTRSIIVLVLDGPTYRIHGNFRHGQTATSILLDEFTVDVTSCFNNAPIVA